MYENDLTINDIIIQHKLFHMEGRHSLKNIMKIVEAITISYFNEIKEYNLSRTTNFTINIITFADISYYGFKIIKYF